MNRERKIVQSKYLNFINLFFMDTIALNGSSGYIGSQICKYFENKYHIIKINRADYLINPYKLAEKINGADIIFNLAGARISLITSKRDKRKMYDSRIETTLNLCKAIEVMDVKPKLFISMSAVGIYDIDHIHNEGSIHFGNDFLARLCVDWESTALNSVLSDNTLIVRSGIVLSREDGILKKVLFPFKVGLGAILGNGKQAFPFVHILDFLRAIEFAIDHHLTGIVNFVAPTFCNNQEFSVALCRQLNRPLMFKVPSFFLKMLMGEQSSMLLEGQKVVPKVLTEKGFIYSFSEIDNALKDLINSK